MSDVLNIEQIKQIIPHREPFLLVDEVTELRVGDGTVAKLTLTGEEDFFKGHFPGNPIMPGVLIVEALAQAGAVAILSHEDFKDKLALFGGINKMRFKHQVVPGDTLVLKTQVTKKNHTAGVATVEATVDGKVAAKGEILFVLVDRK